MINENINLIEILKDCPLGTQFYSPLCGNVLLFYVGNKSEDYPIKIKAKRSRICFILRYNGKYNDDGEIMLFPSKDQRDWNKFSITKKNLSD